MFTDEQGKVHCVAHPWMEFNTVEWKVNVVSILNYIKQDFHFKLLVGSQ
jgi:hypothetical protein